MSILNVGLTRERALIGVDTEALSVEAFKARPSADWPTDPIPPGGRFETSKLFPLIHANVVFAGRGSAGFLTTLFSLTVLSCLADFDQLAKCMPAIFDRVVADVNAAHAKVHGFDEGEFVGSQEIVLVGWSKSRNRMHGRVHCRDAGEAKCDVFEIEPGDAITWVTPWEEDDGQPIEPTDVEKMKGLAREQVRLFRARDPKMAIGGRLLVADLTRDALIIRPVCSLS